MKDLHLKIEVLSSLSGITQDNVLEKFSLKYTNNIFQNLGWICAWLKHYNTLDILFVKVFDNDMLVGYAPLCINLFSEQKVLSFIGYPLNDINSFVSIPGYEDIVENAVFEFLSRNHFNWDFFIASLIDDKDSSIYSTSKYYGFRCIKKTPENLLTIELPTSWSEYCEKFSKKHYNYYKYVKRRVLEKEKYNHFILKDFDEIKNYIEAFNKQRLKNWEVREMMGDVTENIKSKEFCDFIYDLVKLTSKTNNLFFGCIKKDNCIISMGLYFSVNSRLLKYMQTWDNQYSNLCPGTVLDLEMIKYAIENNFTIFDFGLGDEPYKSKLKSKKELLQTYYIFPKINNKNSK